MILNSGMFGLVQLGAPEPACTPPYVSPSPLPWPAGLGLPASAPLLSCSVPLLFTYDLFHCPLKTIFATPFAQYVLLAACTTRSCHRACQSLSAWAETLLATLCCTWHLDQHQVVSQIDSSFLSVPVIVTTFVLKVRCHR